MFLERVVFKVEFCVSYEFSNKNYVPSYAWSKIFILMQENTLMTFYKKSNWIKVFRIIGLVYFHTNSVKKLKNVSRKFFCLEIFCLEFFCLEFFLTILVWKRIQSIIINTFYSIEISHTMPCVFLHKKSMFSFTKW